MAKDFMMEDEIYGFHEKINSRRMSASSRDYSTKIQRAAVLGWAGIIVLKMKRQMVFKGIKFHKKAIRGVQPGGFTTVVRSCRWHESSSSSSSPPIISPERNRRWISLFIPLLKKKLTTRTSSVRECVVNAQC
jgi:hypothetical protein